MRVCALLLCLPGGAGPGPCACARFSIDVDLPKKAKNHILAIFAFLEFNKNRFLAIYAGSQGFGVVIDRPGMAKNTGD